MPADRTVGNVFATTEQGAFFGKCLEFWPQSKGCGESPREAAIFSSLSEEGARLFFVQGRGEACYLAFNQR